MLVRMSGESRAAQASRAMSRGYGLERQGKYPEAADAYREAAALDPDDLGARLRLGLVLRLLGHDEEANAVFHEALLIRSKAC